MRFFKLSSFGDTTISSEFVWIDLGNTPLMGDIKITLGIMLDNIAVLMMFVVMLISFLVHIFLSRIHARRSEIQPLLRLPRVVYFLNGRHRFHA